MHSSRSQVRAENQRVFSAFVVAATTSYYVAACSLHRRYICSSRYGDAGGFCRAALLRMRTGCVTEGPDGKTFAARRPLPPDGVMNMKRTMAIPGAPFTCAGTSTVSGWIIKE